MITIKFGEHLIMIYRIRLPKEITFYQFLIAVIILLLFKARFHIANWHIGRSPFMVMGYHVSKLRGCKTIKNLILWFLKMVLVQHICTRYNHWQKSVHRLNLAMDGLDCLINPHNHVTHCCWLAILLSGPLILLLVIFPFHFDFQFFDL
jgi:hypothetical protein